MVKIRHGFATLNLRRNTLAESFVLKSLWHSSLDFTICQIITVVLKKGWGYLDCFHASEIVF